MNFINKLASVVDSNSNVIGREKYLNSAVLIPIVFIDNAEYILFQKRSQIVRQPGEVSFPGGHFDSKVDSNFLSTAVRETIEELGIAPDKISVLGKFGTLVAPMGVIVEAFIGILKISALEELNIDKSEVEKIFLVPLNYFMNNNPSEFKARIEVHSSFINANGEREELLPVKDLGLPERYALPWTKGEHRVLVYRNTQEIIWGITAELIYDLSNKLKDLN